MGGEKKAGGKEKALMTMSSGLIFSESRPLGFIPRVLTLVVNFSKETNVNMARLARFELTTPWFVAKYSIQLSYSR